MMAAALLSLTAEANSAPLEIQDIALVRAMEQGLGEFADSGEGLSGATLKEWTDAAPLRHAIDLPEPAAPGRQAGYGRMTRSVFLIGSVYKCDKCDDWHFGGSASAWVLSADGLLVTNHHVLVSGRGEGWGVGGVNGKTYRITGVLAADPVADLAVVRVDTRGDRLLPLPLGPDAPVGTPVRVLSHPEGRFFFQTSGEVARYSRLPSRGDQPERAWMSITADYAKGSSGAPVFTRQGRVVGIVANTQSIYYGSRDPERRTDRGPLQMVVKNCVPVAALRRMLSAPETAASPP